MIVNQPHAEIPIDLGQSVFYFAKGLSCFIACKSDVICCSLNCSEIPNSSIELQEALAQMEAGNQ